MGPTKAHRICQWSVFGQDGAVERFRPMSKEPLKQLTAELQRTVTGDRVFLIENIRHPQSHLGDLGCLLGLPVEVFHGLADFERWQVHIKSELPADLLIDIDDGIERIFRKAKMLSPEDNRTKAMIRKLGNSMTATRDLLWFFNSHPEGAQRCHMIMSTLLEVIPKTLESMPLLENSAQSADLQPDAMFFEALAAQLEGQLEECRLHWLFCIRGLIIASDAFEWDGHDAKILCIRASKNVCLIIVDEMPRTSERPKQGLPRVRDDVKSEYEALKFPDPSVEERIIIPQVDYGVGTNTYLTLASFLRQGWPIDILCGEEKFITPHSNVRSSTLLQPPSDFTAIDPRAFLYLLASWSWSERLDRLGKASKQLSFYEIRNTKSAQQFYKLNDNLHSYRKELDIIKENVTNLSKYLPLYLEGYLDDFLVIKQRHTASLPDQLKLMLERTKDLDKSLIDSFQILTSSVSVYESDQSSRQNELSIPITVLAFIYVPLTLVTGIFGMNIVQAPNGFVWWSPLVALLVVVAFTFFITMLALEGVKVWRHHRSPGSGRLERPTSGSSDDEARTGKVSAWERATSLRRNRGLGWRKCNDDLP